ncbi:hypothetical protein [Pandoraea sputorum]|uniref:hypothetical protein n=1 Tax=Pandoraea sputorum TaxID=93222 RepID=UPI00123EDF9F|nr:hypothetical protein [Pandoraea sputorum]VVE78133.1 hypothetical protein PSP31120_01513 [Pandoraea sputorum]
MSKFTVWCPERDQDFADGRAFDAYDEAGAAAKWAEYDDAYSAEYSIVGGKEVTVMVRNEAEQDSSFVVSGEAEPVYFARETRSASQAAEERKS